MTTVCEVYRQPAEAQHAAESLIAAGIPANTIRILQGSPTRNAHEQRTGSFDDHDADLGREGSFADTEEVQHDVRYEREGSFADTEEVQHDESTERAGSFADVDYDTVTTFSHHVEHVDVVDHAKLISMLTDAGLDEATARRDVESLHHGNSLLLVETTASDTERIRAMLRQSHMAE